MFGGHPNLLPAALYRAAIAGPVVAKPALGREGQGVTIHRDGLADAEPGHVYQAFAPLPTFDGNHAVIGSWVIASQPAGIGIREDDGPVTLNTSRFVPHWFEVGQAAACPLQFRVACIHQMRCPTSPCDLR